MSEVQASEELDDLRSAFERTPDASQTGVPGRDTMIGS